MIPFYWPTYTIVIDDDTVILDLLKAIIIPKQNKLLFFTSAEEALRTISELAPVDLSSSIAGYSESDFTTQECKIDLKKSFDLSANQSKYNLISTIICDYDMPYMSGIDFFKECSTKCNARKILLTGRLDPKEAIELKGNVINDYLEKDYKECFPTKLNKKLDDQIKSYFRNFSRPLRSMIDNSTDLSLLKHPLVAEYFKETCQKNDIIEYYLIDYTGTYYLVNNKNENFIFFIQSLEQLDTAIAEYDDIEHKTILIDKLNNKELQVAKLENMSIVYPNYKELEKYLHPIDTVIDNKYYVSLIKVDQ